MKKYTLVPVDEITQHSKISSQHILESLPKNIRNKVRALLSHISNHIQWNEKGEININGDTIPNSHIIDLIKCCFYPHKDFTPQGFEQFKIALSEINTPQTLIGAGVLFNKPSPPPGVPLKTRKQWVWHQM